MAGQGQHYPLHVGDQGSSKGLVPGPEVVDGDLGVLCLVPMGTSRPGSYLTLLSSGKNSPWCVHRWFLAVPARAKPAFFLQQNRKAFQEQKPKFSICQRSSVRNRFSGLLGLLPKDNIHVSPPLAWQTSLMGGNLFDYHLVRVHTWFFPCSPCASFVHQLELPLWSCGVQMDRAWAPSLLQPCEPG